MEVEFNQHLGCRLVCYIGCARQEVGEILFQFKDGLDEIGEEMISYWRLSIKLILVGNGKWSSLISRIGYLAQCRIDVRRGWSGLMLPEWHLTVLPRSQAFFRFWSPVAVGIDTRTRGGSFLRRRRRVLSNDSTNVGGKLLPTHFSGCTAVHHPHQFVQHPIHTCIIIVQCWNPHFTVIQIWNSTWTLDLIVLYWYHSKWSTRTVSKYICPFQIFVMLVFLVHSMNGNER